jgi:hypothetical protein
VVEQINTAAITIEKTAVITATMVAQLQNPKVSARPITQRVQLQQNLIHFQVDNEMVLDGKASCLLLEVLLGKVG